MQVFFESNEPEALELRPQVERRVRTALRRLNWLMPRARVSLSDINGPRGGLDKRCRVELTAHATGAIVITSIAVSGGATLNSALARAAQALLRAWQRQHNSGRRQPRRAALECGR